jgi:hypothetical protein
MALPVSGGSSWTESKRATSRTSVAGRSWVTPELAVNIAIYRGVGLA